MSDRQEVLESWCRQLVSALELEGLEVDIDEVLSLAAEAAHGIVRPAAPLTTFIVGFAAGSASATGQASDKVAIDSAGDVARKLLRQLGADDRDDAGSGAGASKAGSSAPTADSGHGDGSASAGDGLDTGGEDASAEQAQEAVQSSFGRAPSSNREDSK